MKKLFCLIFILSLLIFCSINNTTMTSLFAFSKNGEVSFYCTSYSEISNAKQIKNGKEYITLAKTENAEKIYKDLKSCYGFSIKYYINDISINNLLQKIIICKIQNIESNKVIYGYMNGLIFSTNIENKKVNVQVVVNDNYCYIGSPIIFGMY